MTNMTLSVPEDLHRIMKHHREIRWSEVARKALWEQARKVEIMDDILKDSALTEKEAEAIGTLVKKEIAKKHRLIRTGSSQHS